MDYNQTNFFNSYKVNRFLRRFMIHIIILVGLIILFFFNKPLAGMGFIVWGAGTALWYLTW
ncbi:hypothetical protein A3A76_04330 [Candidatus Woesebacteria bacterium RIFCSPLOWO2_01_FULL_39_23]|uniref:Uncharacterized protein n=1 Tax=Candidatus Woesebacteria bacterium RIFCSPHIGHO2_01_FULL_40_22 TaxID=1802499 RepID=A0A1F7YGG7_9BACT|nr:MAG: hypothetical protein A2141_01895 [Candidatus Woesebacteria bacterium RBG_16_40_11]OGM25979.1 MAG: hypothetical protein A2628_00330 [Candidatus Woesebacteria bacterium RIFCSPHIGHO2_01_FULL_40_22]OGM38091.1 MAG: hypothetical protein A3E41_03415 [Candidatus Woesebacteria bacterium RIFCSPHIGHO2_12_FULL_38_9]OGM61828.1 MAG: hypothetical protein A3A76_04330 [Candidatus Woesebacteria bacterium RIFCSPLOWO2_01_FULL_39_23]